MALGLMTSAQAGTITIDGGCSLAQAINHANATNGGLIAGSNLGAAGTGACSGATAGANTLALSAGTLTFTAADNFWYGPNALPPIQSEIVIEGNGAVLVAQHVGDPTPSAAEAFRFFYVAGGLSGQLQSGALTLRNLVLRGGAAKGGDGGNGGGGGAGMGGAIFNQGTLDLEAVTLDGNSARGGSCDVGSGGNGGGMGQDAQVGSGGGFGLTWAAGVGGAGGSSASFGGAGGGGFLGSQPGSGAATAEGASGGGLGRLGGAGGTAGASPGGSGGDGGGGGATLGATVGGGGGGFGLGGVSGAAMGGNGGGGVGGGGAGNADSAGGGGGFGGGGGPAGTDGEAGDGGFGGGGGAALAAGTAGTGGFGAGLGDGCDAGAGMGGAIFNHLGTTTLLNVTAINNRAEGGSNLSSLERASGLGAALFNLNGTLTISYSTLVENAVDGSNGSPVSLAGDNLGGGAATVYSLALGDRIDTGGASTASLSIANTAVQDTQATGGAVFADIVINRVNGSQANTSSYATPGQVFFGNQLNIAAGGGVSGATPLELDPLADYGGLTPTLRPRTASTLIDNAFGSCPATDQRGVARMQGYACDAGAVEFRQVSLRITVVGDGMVVGSDPPTPRRGGITGCTAVTVTKAQGKGEPIDTAPCNAHYDAELATPGPVTLTATPSMGQQLSGWSGDCAAAGSATEVTVTLVSNRACTATFAVAGTAVSPVIVPSLNHWGLGGLVLLTGLLAALGLRRRTRALKQEQ